MAQQVEENMPPVNIMSLGYLVLLTYDLSVNLDQILLRILIQTRILSNMISEYGLNNILSFNWFERLRVPYILRLYFVLKCVWFTGSFVIFFNQYFDHNIRLNHENSTENYSLFNWIKSWLLLENGTYFEESFVSDIESSSKNTSLVDFSNGLNFTNASTPNLIVTYFVSVGFRYLYTLSSDSTILALIEEQLATFSLNWLVIGSLYFKMVLLTMSSNLVCIAATTSILSYKFYLFGVLVNKLITCSGSNAVNTPNNNHLRQQRRPNNNNGNNDDIDDPNNNNLNEVRIE
jgi:hypothetical protein